MSYANAEPGTPAADIAVDVALVRELIEQQHPDFAALHLREWASGWDNALFRLGETMIVRLPRRRIAAELLVNEQRWLPRLAPRLPLPIPAPLRVGVPSERYPWHWSIAPWFRGESADECAPGPGQGQLLADFLRALHVKAPQDAPRNPVRGVPLAERAAVVQERIARLQTKTDLLSNRLLQFWNEGLRATIDVADTWIHGDLHPRNVLVEAGRLSAVIDWGDIAQGDRATDLAAIWMLLDAVSERQAAMQTYDATRETWRRAQAWAFLFGVTLLDTGLIDHPQHARIGERTLTRLIAGPSIS